MVNDLWTSGAMPGRRPAPGAVCAPLGRAAAAAAFESQSRCARQRRPGESRLTIVTKSGVSVTAEHTPVSKWAEGANRLDCYGGLLDRVRRFCFKRADDRDMDAGERQELHAVLAAGAAGVPTA